jgi:hypothetical protein
VGDGEGESEGEGGGSGLAGVVGLRNEGGWNARYRRASPKANETKLIMSQRLPCLRALSRMM